MQVGTHIKKIIVLDNDNLKIKKSEFIKRFENETKEVKKQVHFNSVINMIDALLVLKNKRDSKVHKESLNKYLDRVMDLKFPIDKLTSLELFNLYLFPTSKYLMFNANFTSNTDFQRSVGFGILLDVILFWLIFSNFGFYFPFLTLIFLIYGYRNKKKSKINKKYFNTYY